ncbi:hypothetical protein HZH66_000636 [Vespula vulgaris]|uniref:Uncharacterized protein n=1 Tax=Vespula vulgaris TaxID=7454 RepID=A0A834NJY4_VESVU|nr:hypothetical protein HZH66_000636 [Vespula vulgaris]
MKETLVVVEEEEEEVVEEEEEEEEVKKEVEENGTREIGSTVSCSAQLGSAQPRIGLGLSSQKRYGFSLTSALSKGAKTFGSGTGEEEKTAFGPSSLQHHPLASLVGDGGGDGGGGGGGGGGGSQAPCTSRRISMGEETKA